MKEPSPTGQPPAPDPSSKVAARTSFDQRDWNDLSVLKVARLCLRGGVNVVPIKADGSKQPTVPWTELQIRRLPEEIANELFSDDVGIAAVCGRVSGNLEIIDFDEPGLFDKWRIDVDQRAPGLVDRLYHAETPRGGDHIGYRCAAIERNQKLAQSPGQDHEGKPKPRIKIETRAEGGYVLLPGSPGECHPKGRLYRHVGGPPITDAPTITPDERQILFDCARALNEWVPPGKRGDDAPKAPGRSTGTGAVESTASANSLSKDRPGDDFSSRTEWDEILEPHGWTVDRRAGPVVYWQRPGKSGGSSATTGHCTTPAGDDVLYVFSTNAYPFESERGYTKFSAHALLNHGGDFKSAAVDLAKKGFGKPASGARASETSEMSTREASDIVTDLLAADTIAPGDPFRPRVLSALATLKWEKRAIFENVREELKKSGVRVGEIDTLLEPKRATDKDLARPLTVLLESLAQERRGSRPSSAQLRQMSDLVIDWLVDRGGRFAYHNDKVFLFWRGKPYHIEDASLEFNALMRDVSGLNIRTQEAKVVWQDLRCYGRTHGVPARPTVWTSTDMTAGVTYLACTPSRLVVIEDGGVRPLANGDQGVFLRYAALVEPFTFDPSVRVADAIDLLDEFVVERIPLPRASALVLTATVIATILRDYCRTRPVTHITGKSNIGKSTAARLLGLLLYGRDAVGIHTLASLYEDGSQSPLQILDNKETRNLTGADIDFLLTSATGITRFKHSRTSDSEVLQQRVDSLVMLTSIEPLPTSELQTRLWRFDVAAQHHQKNFDDITAEQEVLANRATILSGIIKMLGDDVLHWVAGGRLQDLKKSLIKDGIIDTSDRTRDFATLVAAILIPICERTGEKVTNVLRDWMAQRTAASSRAAVGTNDLVYWLEALSHHDRARARSDLPFVVNEDAGVVTFKSTAQQLLLAFRALTKWIGGRPPWSNAEALGCRLANDRAVLRDAGWTWREGKNRLKEFEWDPDASADPRPQVAKRWGRGDR